MNRDFIGTLKNNSAIQKAYELIPKNLHKFLHHNVITFDKGYPFDLKVVHPYTSTEDSRYFLDCAHVAYPCHLTKKKVDSIPHLVLPTNRNAWIIVHELGHILHYNLDKCTFKTKPCTEYALTNHLEAFAEAFTAVICWRDVSGNEDKYFEEDRYFKARMEVDPHFEDFLNTL